MPGVLDGVRVLEFAGQGPGPFCGMLLADLGADVVLVNRPGEGQMGEFGACAIFNRGKRSIELDLKRREHVRVALRLAEVADALIEGFRPGVMERLGLGPETCLSRNPKLVYGRVTGWGQDGPLAQTPGHDINYIGLSGALWYASPPGELPWTPPTLVGDLGGGALYLAVGLLAGLLRVRAGHEGQVVDAAIVDGSANLLNLLLSVRAFGQLTSERGRSPIDGAHWYATYRCSDGRAVTVGAIEPKFYEALLQKLGLASELSVAAQYDPTGWAHGRALLTAVFATKTREEWCRLLQGSDCCFAPVLDIEEAAAHPHLRARGVFSNTDGMLQATPAPRFSAVPPRPPGPVPAKGEHGAEILAELGLDPAEIAALR